MYRRFYQHASCSTLQKLYTSFVRPHLEYASIVWNPYLKSDMYKLEDVQKFALRVCLKSSYDNLLSTSRLPSLEKIRVQASLCHLFKIVRGLTDYDDAPFCTQENAYNTRSSCKSTLTLPNVRVRTNHYHQTFFPNIIKIWNRLPREMTECDSIVTFKKHVIAFLDR